jgi:hypothetical protein
MKGSAETGCGKKLNEGHGFTGCGKGSLAFFVDPNNESWGK